MRQSLTLNIPKTKQKKVTKQYPICVVQILRLNKFMEINIDTDVFWENFTSRFLFFLVFDISTITQLEELENEIQENNNLIVIEMRRSLQANSMKNCYLGNSVTGLIKIWFINQRIYSFIDRPHQSRKCFLSCTLPAYARKISVTIGVRLQRTNEMYRLQRCL